MVDLVPCDQSVQKVHFKYLIDVGYNSLAYSQKMLNVKLTLNRPKNANTVMTGVRSAKFTINIYYLKKQDKTQIKKKMMGCSSSGFQVSVESSFALLRSVIG